MFNQTLLLHVSDAASLLGINSQTIYKLIANGELKAFKIADHGKIQRNLLMIMQTLN